VFSLLNIERTKRKSPILGTAGHHTLKTENELSQKIYVYL
jgi:hypothetical protein